MSDTMTEDKTETLMTSAADTTESTDQQAPEDKAAEAKTDDAKPQDETKPDAKAEDKEKPADTPDPATFEFKMPDGVEMGDETLTGVRDLSKDLGLSNEQAQKIVDLGSQMSQRWAQQLEDAKTAQITEWVEQVKADKDIGGDKFEQSLADAKAAYDKFATPELTSFLNESGLGNHPELIRLFSRLHKQVGDDKLVSGQPAPQGPKTLAERLYGTN